VSETQSPNTKIMPRVDQQPRCGKCGKLLAEYVARPWKFVCVRCKAQNNSPKE
jgi:phage FluMu protein Com